MPSIERVGVSLDAKLLSMFDAFIARQGYANRSEAFRDLIREKLSKEQLAKSATKAVAGVFLVYDHHSTNLSGKLVKLQHGHLFKVIASMHVHLDHDNCLEVIILKGRVGEIEKLANGLACLKGVKLSRINITTTGAGLA